MITRQAVACGRSLEYTWRMKDHTHASVRGPRRIQAARVQSLTQALLARGEISPAQLLSIPETLLGGNDPVRVPIHAGTSQIVADRQSGLTGVLIFGSANRPGGGWLNGAKAQEEDISLASTWATQAKQAAGFYTQENGLGGLGPDRVLVARGYWLVDPNGQVLEPPQPVVFGGVAAPNLANPGIARLPRAQCINHLARRLAGVLLGWEHQGVGIGVLGAIGCGVFQWPGEDSARALRLALNHYRSEGKGTVQVVLAMPDARLAETFNQTLGSTDRCRMRVQR